MYKATDPMNTLRMGILTAFWLKEEEPTVKKQYKVLMDETFSEMSTKAKQDFLGVLERVKAELKLGLVCQN